MRDLHYYCKVAVLAENSKYQPDDCSLDTKTTCDADYILIRLVSSTQIQGKVSKQLELSEKSSTVDCGQKQACLVRNCDPNVSTFVNNINTL